MPRARYARETYSDDRAGAVSHNEVGGLGDGVADLVVGQDGRLRAPGGELGDDGGDGGGGVGEGGDRGGGLGGSASNGGGNGEDALGLHFGGLGWFPKKRGVCVEKGVSMVC